jgi:hypothetical protein
LGAVQRSRPHLIYGKVPLLGLGEDERALKLLEKACEAKDVQLAPLKVSPIYKHLRSDHRFQNILQRIGLG